MDKINETQGIHSDKDHATTNQSSEFKKDAIRIGGSVIGAIVGLAFGGPVGAVLGASTSPTIVMTYNVLNRAIERKRERAINVIEKAFTIAKMTSDDAILILDSDDRKTDDLIYLLKTVAESDPSIDNIMSSIIGESLRTRTVRERERLLILGDALRNMRSTHLRILKALHDSGGMLEATKISEIVDIPIIELRSVVRDLELRGMILDSGKVPIEWKLRELGEMIITFATQKSEEI